MFLRFRNSSRLIWAFVLALVLAACDMTALQIQAQTANAVAIGANAALPTLVNRYRQEGLDVIAGAKTRAEAEASLARVRAAWAPVWRAWDTLRVAQDSWATALERGGDTAAALASLKQAYCGLLRVWPKQIPALPVGPLRCAAPVPPAPKLALPGVNL